MGVFYDTSYCFLALELKILFQYFALAFKIFASPLKSALKPLSFSETSLWAIPL